MTLARKELARTGFRPTEPKPAKGPKPKRCRICKTEFLPRSPMAVVCGVQCSLEHAKKVAALKKAKQQRQERAQDKAKLDSMKTIPQLKAELQTVFNLYIRLRDAGRPCICCGKFATAAALAKSGGAYDSCHYRSRGSADHLRYNEDNVHLGLKDCNTWGHKDYRGGLIKRIGLERVEALEADQALVKWSHDWLRSMKKYYAAKVRELKKANHEHDRVE